MPRKDLHKEPFDEGTIAKLEIFEAYVREWLPVFIHNPRFKYVNICDFFAGTGQDASGEPGSPLRILKVITEYKGLLIKNNYKINLLFNEFEIEKFNVLKNIIDTNKDEYLIKKGLLEIKFENKDFMDIFFDYKDKVINDANLIFLDQNGIKQITQRVFNGLEDFGFTDFLFFISSSYFKRFGEEKSFKEYFPDLDVKALRGMKHGDSHRFICSYYQKKLPNGSKTRIYPFTIMKGPNINGLIFGSKHPLGVDKFLHVAWKTNKMNGEANFDIDDDIEKREPLLFPELKRKTKLDKFCEELEKFILSKSVITNKEVYDFTLEKGHISEHAYSIVRKLKVEKIIEFQGQAKINYDSCYKKCDIINYKIIRR